MSERRKTPAELNEEFEERAAIMEFCGGMTRAEAERQALIRVYGAGSVERAKRAAGVR